MQRSNYCFLDQRLHGEWVYVLATTTVVTKEDVSMASAKARKPSTGTQRSPRIEQCMSNELKAHPSQPEDTQCLKDMRRLWSLEQACPVRKSRSSEPQPVGAMHKRMQPMVSDFSSEDRNPDFYLNFKCSS